jgi:predicted signal transduction protein with EAL and GGDEF domain
MNVNVEHRCTASIGVTLFTGLEANQDEIFKMADEAMYQAKYAGRNLIRFYDPTAPSNNMGDLISKWEGILTTFGETLL